MFPIIVYNQLSLGLLYAVKLAIDKGVKSKDSQAFLMSMMDKLDQVRSN